MPSSLPLRVLLVLVVAVGGAALARWMTKPPMTVAPGTLLSVGASAKADAYAVAQGAVTHGEAVLIDFGDGDFAFFVNHAEDVAALVNACGDRVPPVQYQRFPVLVDARFTTRRAPPYTVEARTTHYRFDAPTSERSADCS